jgi:hypothetical protein
MLSEAYRIADPSSSELRPMLFVDINLGEDQIERIVVFEGNTAT